MTKDRKKQKPSRNCYLCGKRCWGRTCKECYNKGKNRNPSVIYNEYSKRRYKYE